MKDETAGIVVKEVVGLKPKMYSFLGDDHYVVNNNNNNNNVMNKNVVATISHSKFKDVFLNDKCLGQLMNKIQSKNHRMGNYEINKIS